MRNKIITQILLMILIAISCEAQYGGRSSNPVPSLSILAVGAEDDAKRRALNVDNSSVKNGQIRANNCSKQSQLQPSMKEKILVLICLTLGFFLIITCAII